MCYINQSYKYKYKVNNLNNKKSFNQGYSINQTCLFLKQLDHALHQCEMFEVHISAREMVTVDKSLLLSVSKYKMFSNIYKTQLTNQPKQLEHVSKQKYRFSTRLYFSPQLDQLLWRRQPRAGLFPLLSSAITTQLSLA